MKWRFVCDNDPISRAIAWWGNGWHGFAHVDAVIAPSSSSPVKSPSGTFSGGGLLGARSEWIMGKPPGVQLRPNNYLKGKQIRISILDLWLHPDTERNLIDWLISQIGRRYDINNIADLLLGRQIPSSGRWICSAAQDEGCVKFGVYHPTGVPPQQITPDTFHALLCSHGATESFSYEGPAI